MDLVKPPKEHKSVSFPGATTQAGLHREAWGRTHFHGDSIDICQKLLALRLQAGEMGKDAGGFLFWTKICQSHQLPGAVGG